MLIEQVSNELYNHLKATISFDEFTVASVCVSFFRLVHRLINLPLTYILEYYRFRAELQVFLV